MCRVIRVRLSYKAGRRINLVLLESNKVEGNHDIAGQHVWLVLHLYNGFVGSSF